MRTVNAQHFQICVAYSFFAQFFRVSATPVYFARKVLRVSGKRSDPSLRHGCISGGRLLEETSEEIPISGAGGVSYRPAHPTDFHALYSHFQHDVKKEDDDANENDDYVEVMEMECGKCCMFSLCVCVCVCVYKRERESVYVCMCTSIGVCVCVCVYM